MNHKPETDPIRRMILQSRVNGAPYIEPELIDSAPIQWPRSTWLQRRRAEIAAAAANEKGKQDAETILIIVSSYPLTTTRQCTILEQ